MAVGANKSPALTGIRTGVYEFQSKIMMMIDRFTLSARG
jgi:hypothetical protein